MVKKINLNLLVSAIAIVFASIYLAFIVDVYTLNTWLKRIFVLFYFVVMTVVAAKSLTWFKINKYNLISALALLLAIVTLVFSQNAFLPAENEHVFYIQSLPSETSECGKIDLSEITVDEEKQTLSKMNVETLGNWLYSAESDSFIFMPTEASSGNLISFTLIGETVSFSFKTEAIESHIRVYDDYGYDQTVSIINGNDEMQTHSIEFNKTYSITERLIYNVGASIVMAFVYKILLELSFKFVNKNFKKKSSTK
jgi:hypothetical protein